MRLGWSCNSPVHEVSGKLLHRHSTYLQWIHCDGDKYFKSYGTPRGRNQSNVAIYSSYILYIFGRISCWAYRCHRPVLEKYVCKRVKSCHLQHMLTRLVVVGKRPQGTLMGWFASVGSLARIIFPILSGYIANCTDIVLLFWLLIGILLLSTVFVLAFRRALTLLSTSRG